MTVVGVIVYCFIGLVLAVPYCLLAGWSPESLPAVATFGPAFLLIWLLFGVTSGVVVPNSNRKWLPVRFHWRGSRSKSTAPRSVFWIWTAYGLLPILVHWSSMLLGKMGYSEIALLLNANRYMSIVYVFLGGLVVACLLIVAFGVWEGLKNARTWVLHHVPWRVSH
ncbi:MAG: hypothetical protein NUW02_02075 [Candidatus Campbellbacteria bacterium]|nr:hypothetical protein [Candidatus Campbellbacteria bacterium]